MKDKSWARCNLDLRVLPRLYVYVEGGSYFVDYLDLIIWALSKAVPENLYRWAGFFID